MQEGRECDRPAQPSTALRRRPTPNDFHVDRLFAQVNTRSAALLALVSGRVAGLAAAVMSVGRLAVDVPHVADLALEPVVLNAHGLFCVDVKVPPRARRARRRRTAATALTRC